MELFINKPAKGRQYLVSILFILAVTVICYFISAWVGYRVIAFVLLLAVSILAITFDILPVLLSAALSAFIWDFFFIPPRFTLHVDTAEDAILLIMYFVIALISGVLTFKIRQVEKAARLKEERANSVKLYNTILDSLSHELRTPIAAIIGATDNLQINANLSAVEKDQLVAVISKASLRLNQQVENLLNISRLESGHIQPKKDWCDVQELIYETIKSVEENNPQRKVQVSMSDTIPPCMLDKVMLQQIVYNLLSNAATHTQKDAAIEITVLYHPGVLQLVIEDSGTGFLNMDLHTVFHKFSREREMKGAHSGLGLSIVKGFTEALNGTVELANKKTGGALFTIYLPVKAASIKGNYEQS